VRVDEAIVGRRTVRSYTRREVDHAVILRLVDAAIHAPSAMNEQPWAFAVIRDQNLLGELSSRAKRHTLETLSAGSNSDPYRKHLVDPKFNIFYDAPVLVLICAKRAGAWIAEDCALAAENLMLTAFAEGLGSCWVGFAQGYLQLAEGKALAGIPQEWVPAAPIIVGHPSVRPDAVPRREPTMLWVG